uniref:Putative outer membrane protein n=1 Tax=Rhodopseudomonas palustris (strain BisA53) TaxID=316055 RepID=Q07TE6_RHOP5
MTIKRKLLLTSAAFAVATAAPFSANAADAPAAPGPVAVPLDFWAAHGGVTFSGEFEVGGRAFIKRPPKSAFPWLDGNRNNRSKFEEYGEVPPGFFAEYLRLTTQTNDGMYWHELRADNIGYNNQRYIFDYSKAGEHYFTASWDQIPHLYSTSARSIWNGVGTNGLTTSVNIAGPTVTPATAGLLTAALAGRANTIDIGIQRNKGVVAYRWTPDPHWDVKASYSNERREGTQIAGVYVGGSPAPANAQQFQVPRPIDDTTHIAKLNSEYFGPTPWGGRYNVNVGGGVSLFENEFNSFTVQNPFSTPGNALYPATARVSLMPSNQAYNGIVTTGVDLPLKSRWNSTFQYTSMRQNEPFMPLTSNTSLNVFGTAIPAYTTAALPALSLNGEINTLLYNTNLTTKWTEDFRSTFRYRYFNSDNQTPELLLPRYVVEDSVNTGVVRRSLAMSYTKQNASEDFQWRPAKWVTLGSSFGWEQWDRTHREVQITNEFIGRGTADFRIYDVATLRSSLQYSERRHDTYDPRTLSLYVYNNTNQATTNYLLRKYDMADRDQSKGNVFLDISGPSGTVFRDFVISPTAGFKHDDYREDPLNFGLKKSHSWNAGVDGTYTFKPGNWIQASYLYEQYDRFQVGGAGTSTPINPGAPSAFGSNTNERVHTITAATNFDVIPGVLDMKIGYSISYGNEDWDYSSYMNYPTAFAGMTDFPTVRNNYQRLDASLRHTVDPSIVAKLGWASEVYLRARYVWERNSVENWQQEGMSPLLYLNDTAVARLIEMGGTNPNYDAQFVQLSLNAKW